jgi:hypothetical protein
MNPDQSNTRPAGTFVAHAAEDLTVDHRSRLVVPTYSDAELRFKLPDSIDDDALYILQDFGDYGEEIEVEKLDPAKTYRVRLKGTCNPGDRLCLAAIAGGDDGKVRTVPEDADTYTILAIAEEKGVDGQLVLVRPVSPFAVVVT